MEIWTDVEFTMPTNLDYMIMEKILMSSYDNSGHCPVEKCDPEARTITFATACVTQDAAVEVATDMLEKLLNRMKEGASGKILDAIVGLSYTMHGHTKEGGYTEIDFIIERNGDKLTMKESFFSHESFFFNKAFSEEIDKEREEAYAKWLDNPTYGGVIDLKKKRMRANEVVNANEMIIEYLKANNLPHDEAAIDRLSVDDVYAIMAGTYGK